MYSLNYFVTERFQSQTGTTSYLDIIRSWLSGSRRDVSIPDGNYKLFGRYGQASLKNCVSGFNPRRELQAIWTAPLTV